MSDLSQISIAECDLSVRTTNMLAFHRLTTLGQVDALTDAYLRPKLGRRGLKEIREVIAAAKGTQPTLLAAA